MSSKNPFNIRTYSKPKWSNLDGDFESKEWAATFNGVDHRWCQNCAGWKPTTEFRFHHKGRYAGFYFVVCTTCEPFRRTIFNKRYKNLKSEFDQNVAAGLLVYNTDTPPYQCSHCFVYRNPPIDSMAHPREFDQKDDGTWYKWCTWCCENRDRTWELLQEEIAHHTNQVKTCRNCHEIKIRSDFVVKTVVGFKVRSCCVTCRPKRTALWKQRRAENFAAKNQEKNRALDLYGCASYKDKSDALFPCPFGFDTNDVDFDDFVDELRHLMGPSFTTAFDYHHPGEKTNEASQIWDEYGRNLETEGLCDFRCKFCHEIHHRLELGPSRHPEVTRYKLQEILQFGCAGPGQDDECPFGFQPTPTLHLLVADLEGKSGDYVVTALFNNDHNHRTANRDNRKPAAARTVTEYIHLTRDCTLRCKMCDAVKTHRSGDNVPLIYMEI